MKLLNLFPTGTTGTAGTSLQGQGFSPSRLTGAETGQRDENTGTELSVASSRPVRPGPDFINGTGESVAALGPSRSSRSSHPETEQNISDDPTPEQIAHARRMLVDCPSTGGRLHCWHCSRCGDAERCTAWHHRRQDVEFFKRSGPPYSLSLVEGEAEPATAAANALPAWTDICPDYFMGCFDCPHYRASLLYFCGKFTREGVLQ